MCIGLPPSVCEGSIYMCLGPPIGLNPLDWVPNDQNYLSFEVEKRDCHLLTGKFAVNSYFSIYLILVLILLDDKIF